MTQMIEDFEPPTDAWTAFLVIRESVAMAADKLGHFGFAMYLRSNDINYDGMYTFFDMLIVLANGCGAECSSMWRKFGENAMCDHHPHLLVRKHLETRFNVLDVPELQAIAAAAILIIPIDYDDEDEDEQYERAESWPPFIKLVNAA